MFELEICEDEYFLNIFGKFMCNGYKYKYYYVF